MPTIGNVAVLPALAAGLVACENTLRGAGQAVEDAAEQQVCRRDDGRAALDI